MNKYMLLKEYDSPTMHIAKNVIKTESEWMKIFNYLESGHCEIKKDWFQKIETNDYPIFKNHDQNSPVGIIRIEKEYADTLTNMSFKGFNIIFSPQAKRKDGKYEMLSVSFVPELNIKEGQEK